VNIRKLVALLALLTLCGAGVARADDDDDDDDKRGRPRINIPGREANGGPLEFRLIPVSAFNPSIGVTGTGTDQLAPDTKNHIAVLNNRTVEIEFHPVVTPAVSPLTYRVWFCRFGAFIAPETQGGSGCVALLDPASKATPKAALDLTVDTSGAAKGVAVFPSLAANSPAGSDVWAGLFVVTRGIGTPAISVIQFVSAFEFPSAPDQKPVPAERGAEVELKGEVSALDIPNKAFQLAGVSAFKVIVNGSTNFTGRHKSLEDLNVGQEVEVRGTFETDLATNTLVVLADRIKAGRED
jgi:hypothetical protein